MKRPLLAVALVLTAVAALRLAAVGKKPPNIESEAALPASGETLLLTGRVCRKETDSIYLTSVILFSSNQAAASQQKIPYQKQLLCELCDTGQAQSVALDSIVTVQGRYAALSEAENPGEFDGVTYYGSIGVGGILRETQLLEESSPVLPLREALYQLRCRLRARLYSSLPEKEAGIMAALLLGDTGDLDGNTKELYRRCGILHILSISSQHITILGMGLYRLLRRMGLPLRAAAVTGALAMLLYGVMTGFGVSVCRAVCMYLLHMLADLTGRTYDMLSALGGVGSCMLIANPNYLEHCGFLLSFTCVLAIGAVYPVLQEIRGERQPRQRFGENSLRRLARRLGRGVEDTTLMSLSITLLTLPIQLWFFYEVPLYGLMIGLLVLPLVRPLLLSGLVLLLWPAGAAGSLLPLLILGWYEKLCAFFTRLPFSTWNPGRPEVWQMVLYYLLLGGLLLVGRGKDITRCITTWKLRWRRSVLLLLCLPSLLLALGGRGENRVTFLSVGQGDCGIVQTAAGHTYLIDCGSSSRSRVGKYVLLPFLKYQGIRRLDAVILTHPDTDHVNGALELLEMAEENGISVGQLLLPDIAAGRKQEELGELLEGAAKAYSGRGVAVRYLAEGEGWQSGDARFLCLHPQTGCTTENANAYSVCLYAAFGGMEQPDMTVLFTGDVEGEGEEELCEALKKYGISGVTLLKVAHHGSRGSTSEKFLEQLQPEAALISVGRNSTYGHPHEEVLERLEALDCRVLRTDESGAVSVSVRGGVPYLSSYQRRVPEIR